MNFKLVHQIPPSQNNPRNSEGAFLRGKHGEILFAYSRYCGSSKEDNAACDIALIVSYDEGETWSSPRIIAPAAFFGVKNVMSVSALHQQNGDLAFYFLIKENGDELTSTLGRALSADGINWTCERCVCNVPSAYYVVNNDRIVRLSDGSLIAPAAIYTETRDQSARKSISYATALISHDDGKSFERTEWVFSPAEITPWTRGFEEPGIIEYADRLYYWIRTDLGRQYECISTGGAEEFCFPRPSIFTSPRSPMQIKTVDGTSYAVYNPIPRYDGRVELGESWGRTPLVIRKSEDGGNTWGQLNVIEDDEERGFCYPAIFATRDSSLLLAYCRGNAEDGDTLCRLGIAKIGIDSIE